MTDDDMRDSDIERQLRESLRRHAERITPRERRTEILAMVHEQTETSEPRRRWLIPVAAAASVALIGAIAWGVANTGNQQVTPAATSTSSATGPTTSNPGRSIPFSSR